MTTPPFRVERTPAGWQLVGPGGRWSRAGGDDEYKAKIEALAEFASEVWAMAMESTRKGTNDYGLEPFTRSTNCS